MYLDAFGEECRKMFEEYTIEKKPPLPPPVVEEKPAPKVEEKKEKEDPVREKDTADVVKEDIPDRRQAKERDRYTRPPYANSTRGDYPTPSSSDMGYGTQSETYSTSYGSTNTTPIR